MKNLRQKLWSVMAVMFVISLSLGPRHRSAARPIPPATHKNAASQGRTDVSGFPQQQRPHNYPYVQQPFARCSRQQPARQHQSLHTIMGRGWPGEHTTHPSSKHPNTDTTQTYMHLQDTCSCRCLVLHPSTQEKCHIFFHFLSTHYSICIIPTKAYHVYITRF